MLNRTNGRNTIFHTHEGFAAFERMLDEGLERYDVQLLGFQLMADHWRLVLACDSRRSESVHALDQGDSYEALSCSLPYVW